MNKTHAALLSAFLTASMPSQAGFISAFGSDKIESKPKRSDWKDDPEAYYELDTKYGPLYYMAIDVDPIDDLDFQQGRITIAGYDKNETLIHCFDSVSFHAFQTSETPLFSGPPAFRLTVRDNKPARAIFLKEQCQRMNGSLHEVVFKPAEIMSRIHDKEQKALDLYNLLQQRIEAEQEASPSNE